MGKPKTVNVEMCAPSEQGPWPCWSLLSSLDHEEMIQEEVVYSGVDPSKFSEGMGRETGKIGELGKGYANECVTAWGSWLSDCTAVSESSH